MGVRHGKQSAETVVLNLRVQSAKPLDDSENVFVAGSDPKLGNWKPDLIRLDREDSRNFSLAVGVPYGKALEFKITRGSWKSQAIFDLNARVPPDNLLIKPYASETLEIKVLDWLDRLPVTADPICGELHTHEAHGTKAGLRYQHDLLVWLPTSYNSSTERFPVLYMHDGQNLFEPHTSFTGQDWKVDETASRLIAEGKLRGFIVVGIANSPDRMEEYNLFRPLGKAYARFLIEEVKPFIDATYRTCPDADNTAVMGSSMGGLISFQLVWRFPKVFSAAGCLSSAFYKSRSRILQVVDREPLPPRTRYYIDVGEHEPPLHHGYEKMAELLRGKGCVEGRDFVARFFEGATHSESAWNTRLHIPLTFLFG